MPRDDHKACSAIGQKLKDYFLRNTDYIVKTDQMLKLKRPV